MSLVSYILECTYNPKNFVIDIMHNNGSRFFLSLIIISDFRFSKIAIRFLFEKKITHPVQILSNIYLTLQHRDLLNLLWGHNIRFEIPC